MSTSRRRAGAASSHGELLTVIRQLLPRARNNALPLLLADLPLHAPQSITVTAHPAPLLKPQNVSRAATPLPPHSIAHWQEEHLLTVPNPHLAFVIEGVADLEIGVTAQLARHAKIERRRARFTIRLPQGSGVLFPPHIPRSDGLRPHWCPAPGETMEAGQSRILWLNFLPEGVLGHICCTQGETHHADARSFVLAPQLMNLAELLMNELRHAASEIAGLHLMALLLHIERELSGGHATADESGHRIVAPTRSGDMSVHSRLANSTATIRLATRYIENHLAEPLSADQIARQCYVSASHLNRLFRTQHGLSLMKFVEQQRVQAAQSLLVNTNLPVATIGHHVGYIHLPQFSLVFKRVSGLSPSQYRQSQRPQKPVCERR